MKYKLFLQEGGAMPAEDPAAMEKARAIVKELTDKYPLHKKFRG